MNIIETVSDRKFSLNGVQYLKNYITRPAGEKLSIYNCYENGDVLIPFTNYSEFTVNGDTFQSAEALQEALLDVVFARLPLGGSIVQDNKTIRKYFNVGSDFITLEAALALINALPTYTVSEIESVLFVSRSTAPQVNGFTPPVFKFKMIGRGKGTYGIGGTQLFKTNLELIYSQPSTSLEDIENDESTDIINYGSIIGQTIDQWLNLHAPIMVQPISEGYTLFKGSIGGLQKDYLFIGEAAIFGVGETQATGDDFQLLSGMVASTVNTLQQVTTQGNVSTKSVIIKHLTTQEQTQHLSNGQLYQHANGSTVYIEQENPISQSVKYTIPAKAANDKFAMISDLEELVGAYIPLSGTTLENQITGTIEFNTTYPLSIGYNEDVDDVGMFRVSDGIVQMNNPGAITEQNTSNGTSTQATVFQGALTIASSEPNAKGLRGYQDFTPNITDLDYTQKKYVDNNFSKTFLSDPNDGPSITGTTSETILGTCLIPANSPMGIFEVITKIEKTGTSGSIGIKFYLNTTPDLSGIPVQIAVQTAGGTNLVHRFSREFTLKEGGLFQGYNFSSPSANDYSASTAPSGSASINPLINHYIILAASLGNAADSLKKKSFSVVFNRQHN